ncbi:MAG: amidohydrolase family protein [Candidatus Hodarchaeota archaeon]
MVISKQIFSKFALIGSDLDLKENVLISIDNKGRISNIEFNLSFRSLEKNQGFIHHLVVPKFINSHTHIGDAALKDRAYNLSLDEAVGIEGIKYNVNNVIKKQRILAMRSAIIEMIQCGISACYDFREGGLKGINEIKEASLNLPIDLHILGRPSEDNTPTEIVSQCDGLGIPTPLIYSLENLKNIASEISSLNTLIATHISENAEVIQKSINKFGFTDLQVALRYLNPKILIHLTALKAEDILDIPKSKFIVFCPRSNAYFGSGFPNVRYFLNKKYLIGLGTDNIMVMAPNILEELRWLILRLKEENYSINPIEALKMITSNPSEAFGIQTGCIKTGYWADLLIIDLNSARTRFGNDPIMTLLFRSQFPEDIHFNLYHGEKILNESRLFKM